LSLHINTTVQTEQAMNNIVRGAGLETAAD